MNVALIIFLTLHAIGIQLVHLVLFRMGKVNIPPKWSMLYSLFIYFFLIPPIVFVLVDDLTGLIGANTIYLFLIVPALLISSVIFLLTRKRKNQ